MHHLLMMQSNNPFVITSTDVNAGSTAGGTLVHVQGRGFCSGMTSNLGAVSAITYTSCTITTNAHAPASFSWTLTCPGGGSATPAQTFTYADPPVILSATDVGTTGGSGTITGSNFVATPTGKITISGTDFPLTITFVSSTQLTFVLPAGVYTAGTNYPLTITNPSGVSGVANVFNVDATTTPATRFGSNLKFWQRSDFGVQNGGVTPGNGRPADTWLDKSGNGANATGTAGQRPTYNTSASISPSFPSLSFDGVGNQLTISGLNIGSTTDLCIWMVLKDNAGTARVWMQFQDNALHTYKMGASGSPGDVALSGSFGTVVFPTAVTNGNQFYTEFHGNGASGTIKCAAQNATASSGAASLFNIAAGAGTLIIGSDGAASFGQYEILEVFGVSGVNMSSADLLAMAEYINLRYFNYAPSFIASTEMLNTGTGFRIHGGGFVNGITIDFGGGLGVTTQIATVVSPTLIEVPMPGTALTPGSYPITLTNPDGGSITEVGGFTNTNSATATPMTVTGDLSCVGWYLLDNAHITPGSGSGIQKVTDQSLRQSTDWNQTIAADQPQLITADADFGGVNSASFNGTSHTWPIAAFDMASSSPTGATVAAMVKVDVSNPTSTLFDYISGININFGTSAGKPFLGRGGSFAIWGSTVGGVVHEMLGTTDVAGVTTKINVDNSGSPVSTGASGAITNNAAAQWGSNTTPAQFYKGKCAGLFIFNRVLTPTEQTNLETYITNNL